MEKGIRGEASQKADRGTTAAAVGSGRLDVYATPMMIALIERAAHTSVEPHLEKGMGTVGTSLDIKHLSATPIGMTVTAETELIEVDGRRLVFRAEVRDEAGKIGEGTHERFIVQCEKFMSKANGKLAQ